MDIRTESIVLNPRYSPEEDTVGVITFVLDGIAYKAVEDPDDGYRSLLGELLVCDDKISNTFPPHTVIGAMKESDYSGDHSDVIQFKDEITGEIVLEVGTEDINDYYPMCVMRWRPQNLAINVKHIKE